MQPFTWQGINDPEIKSVFAWINPFQQWMYLGRKGQYKSKTKKFLQFQTLNFCFHVESCRICCTDLSFTISWTIPVICRLFLNNNWCNMSLFSFPLILILLNPCPVIALPCDSVTESLLISNFVQIVDFSRLLHGLVKIDTRISLLSIYMDFSKLLHGFL